MNRTLRIGAGSTLTVAAVATSFWLLRPVPAPAAANEAAPVVMTVEAVRPQTQMWPRQIEASGPIAAWQEIVVSPETGGLRIAELRADVAMHVRRGELLARLADDTVRAEQRKQRAAVADAEAQLRLAQSNLRRAEALSGTGALSGQQMEEYRIKAETAAAGLESARAQLQAIDLKLAQTRIVAADDGIVSSRSAVLGDVVATGQELFRLVRQARLEWRPELDARQLAGVQPGSPATLTLPDGSTARGRVRTIDPTLDASTGRSRVYVSLPPDSVARAGMYAGGAIELETAPALTVPESAVVLRDGRPYVYTIEADGTVRLLGVSSGRRRGDRIEILSGLATDVRLVAAGGAFLSDGARVDVAAAGDAR